MELRSFVRKNYLAGFLPDFWFSLTYLTELLPAYAKSYLS